MLNHSGSVPQVPTILKISFLILTVCFFSILPVSAITIESYSWGDKIIYNDGTFEINQHSNNYQTWASVWENKDLMQAGTSHYPYLIVDDGTQWTLTKNGEVFTLPKNSIYSYSFNPYHIGMTITATPAQLNSISTYQNVAGNDTWYIVIQNQIVNNVKIFNWDNKLPRVSNGSLVNGSLFYLNQSNFEYHVVDDEIRFYYNQEARDFGQVSSELTFEFNSWYVVGDGGSAWLGNVTVGSNMTLVQATGNIELQDAVPHFISKWRFDDNSTLDENTSNFNDGSNYGATYDSSGYYGGAFDFNGVNNYIDNGDVNFSESFTVSAVVNFSSLNQVYTRIVGKGWEEDFFLGTSSSAESKFSFSVNATVVEDILISDSSYTADGSFYHVVGRYNETHISIFVDGIQSGSLAWTTNPENSTYPLRIGTRSGSDGLGRYFNGSIDDVRIYDVALTQTEINQIRDNNHKISGNLTQNIYDSGAGNEIQKIGNNGTFADGTVSVGLQINSSADNSSWTGWYTVQSNITTGTMYDVPVGYQKQYYQVRSVLSTTDASQTPIITNIRSLIGSAGAAPTNIQTTRY
jgi:hypothetical protein